MFYQLLNISNSKKLLQVLCISCVLLLASVGYAQTYTVNFKDADIQQLIKFVADSTGKTIVVDPRVKGKVQVISSKALTKTELYDLFLSVLEINGFTAVDAGGVIRVVASREARTQPLPVDISSSKENFSGYLTQVIQVRNVEANKLIPVLRPLVPPEAHLAAYPDSNVIVITDSAQNIQRIRKVIERLDNASSEETEVIRLHNASAEDAVKTLDNLQNAQTGGAVGGESGGRSLQNQAQIVADVRTNSILVTGPKVARDRIRALAERIDRPIEQLSGARVIRLKHAIAKELVTVLTKVAESNNAKGGRQTVIQADEATNAIILSGSADMVQMLGGVIGQLDTQRAQVLIEAIIVEVSDDDAKELGINWLFANEEKGFGTSGSSLPGQLLGASAGTDSIASLGAILSGVSNTVFGVAKFNPSGTNFVALLKALQSNTEANILSTPSLLTMDNHEAEIVVGQEVPFITGSYTNTGGTNSANNPFQTISRENVGLTLKVTPHISDGGNITMDLLQEVSNVTDSNIASDVITNERKIKTTVSTQDGQIVVLGGLVRDEVREKQHKVPFLGDIPLLGRLFKTESTGLTKSHLMVFIRPTIVKTTNRLEEVSRNRYSNVRNAQNAARQDGIDLYKDSVAPVLPDYNSQTGSNQPIMREDPRLYDSKQRKKKPMYQNKPAQQQPNYRPAQVSPAPIQEEPFNRGDTRFTPPPGFAPVESDGSQSYRPTSNARSSAVIREPVRRPVTERSNQNTSTRPVVRNRQELAAPPTSNAGFGEYYPVEDYSNLSRNKADTTLSPADKGDVQRSEEELDNLYKEITY